MAGKAEEKDVPVYLDGLGTVQAFNTVTVHTRVDGELQQVLFTKGQAVTGSRFIPRRLSTLLWINYGNAGRCAAVAGKIN